MRPLAPMAAILLAGGGVSCSKVPIQSVEAEFALADVIWFAEERTLFVFYEVSAEQGLGDPSVIELEYVTDGETVPWTPLSDLNPVHTHVEVDCGANTLCGSMSLHVGQEPRKADLRLRYHRDGELALVADTELYVVGEGSPWSHRSFLVYGVFDETNQWVQWRGRHQFPDLRNEEAEEYGLRRWFSVDDQRYGTAQFASADNPYGYGLRCPPNFESTDLEPVETEDRAVFNQGPIPDEAVTASTLCADVTVNDATGPYTAAAIARKNPEVRPAFSTLRSPVRDATTIPFFLGPCERTISAEHEEMQRQRLLLGDLETTCIDDWDESGFADELEATFSEAVEAERANGNDMVLVIALHQDETAVSEVVEQALAGIVPEEHGTSSPRLAGAFVFDSDVWGMSLSELEPMTLWCPSTESYSTDTGGEYDVSATCAISPDSEDYELGPFTFGTLPVLPSRDRYLEFIETYSEAQAGWVTALSFRVPEFSTTSEHVEVEEYGMVTYLDGEIISAEKKDAFSYCTGEDYQVVVFRSDLLASDFAQLLIAEQCIAGTLDEEFCELATYGLLPLEWLPTWHDLIGEQTYELGLYWDFPYLLHMQYETYLAGSVQAFGLSIPFGLSEPGETYVGSEVWMAEEFSLEDLVTQCTRFCDHPTFDASGVYQVADPFRSTYANTCYLPDYPEPGDSGYPLDP